MEEGKVNCLKLLGGDSSSKEGEAEEDDLLQQKCTARPSQDDVINKHPVVNYIHFTTYSKQTGSLSWV